MFPLSARADSKSKVLREANVTVQAFADRETVVPGGSVELAVSLKIAAGWHVYWMNPNATGMPTEITWKAPDGYGVGRVRFPVPESKYSKILDETSFIHEKTAVFLTTVRVPATAKVGEPAKFTAKITWLACKENCIPGDAEVSLSLPVFSTGTQPKPAHAKVFEAGREALPAEKGSYVKLSGSIDRKAVKPGEKFTATLTVEIKDKHHTQSHKPAQEGFIATEVFVAVEPADDIEIGDVVYPKAHERLDPVLGKMSEYSGKVEFKIPLEIDSSAEKTPRWIRGVLQHQVCNDSGTCYRPEYAAFAIPLQFEGGAKPSEAPSAAGSGSSSLSADAGTAAPDSVFVEYDTGIIGRFQSWLLSFGYAGALVMALIGGVILNLMPCVLPVISLKVLSFVRQSNEDRKRILELGLAYCAGILVFFGFIAVLYWRAGTGWGQLFQRPHIVLALSAIVTAFAMSLFGVFAVFTPKVINKLGQSAEGEGLSSAFFTGILATILGTACTAPFLSAALGAASKFEPVQGAGIFFAVGIGMAMPFFLLSANPSWVRLIPKPGPWMVTFERVMGFLLLATVIWLLNTVRGQLGDFGLLMTLIFLLAVTAAVFVKGKIQFGDQISRKLKLNGIALSILLIGWAFPFRIMSTVGDLRSARAEEKKLVGLGKLWLQSDGGNDAFKTWNPDWSKGITWLPFTPDYVRRHVENGFTVFVDFTADWCPNCKVNLKTSIDREETIQVMKELNVVTYEADYSDYAPEIFETLKKFGADAVPLYLVYRPGKPGEPQILPTLLTPQIVIDALQKAGPSRSAADTVASAASARSDRGSGPGRRPPTDP